YLLCSVTLSLLFLASFVFHDPAPTESYTLSLHDALPISVATVLVFAMISPAFAQPFADTPTNHWAYDAIAELAAKGLVEGYPDGDRKSTRLNSSHRTISYAVFCLKKKKNKQHITKNKDQY